MRMQGQLDTAAQRARPLAGRPRRRGAGGRGHRGDLRQRPGARLRHRAGAGRAGSACRSPTDTGLRERSFGVFQGHTYADIDQRWPAEAARWRHHDPDFGPEGGETLREFSARAVAACSRIAAGQAGRSIAIVTHGGVLDCLYRAAAGVELDAPRSWELGNAAINRLLYTPRGFTLVGWSDTAHLEGEMTLDDGSEGDPVMPVGPGAAMSASAGAFVPKVGDPVAAIDTPALVIDLDAMERNLAAMADFARARDVRLRPHAKMHKCAAIARLQRAAGAVGVCVQKTSEAEALAAAGVDDIYISNEVIDRAKLARVARLASRVRLAIAVDSVEGIERLAAAVREAGAAHRRVRRDRRRPRPLRRRRPPRPARSPSRSSRMRRPKAACASPACRPTTAAAQHLRGAEEREAAIAPRGVAGERGAGQRSPPPASPAR